MINYFKDTLDILTDALETIDDTDVELIKSLDPLLYEKGFCGFENDENVAFGLGFGATKANFTIKAILDFYKNLEWDGGKIACPIYQTEILKKFGLDVSGKFQRLNDMVILPVECLCGKSLYSRRIVITDNTFSIHHYSALWVDDIRRENLRFKEDNFSLVTE